MDMSILITMLYFYVLLTDVAILCLQKTGNFTAIKPFWKKDSSNKLGRFEEWVM